MTEQNVDHWPARKQLSYHQERMQAAIRDAAQMAEKAYRNQNPQAGGLKTKSEIRVYLKRPKGFSGYPSRMVYGMLNSPIALREPNKAFIERLQAQYPNYRVPIGLMSYPVPPKELERISKLLKASGRNINLKLNNTLSKIKLALRAKDTVASTQRTYNLQLAFGDKSVVANGVNLTVSHDAKGYDRIRLGVGDKRQWLRCDVLELLAMK